MNIPVLLIIAGLLLAPAQALDHQWFRGNVDVSSSLASLEVTDQQVVAVGTNTAGILYDALISGLPEGVEIDALLVQAGFIMFSTDIGFSTPSFSAEDEDVIAYDPATGGLSMIMDGSVAGIPAYADVDAVSLTRGVVYTAGRLLISLDVSAELPGVGLVDDDDIIRWDAGPFAIMIDPVATLNLPPEADLDALHWTGEAAYLSFDIDTSVRGIAGDDAAVWRWDLNHDTVTILSALPVDSTADLISLDEPLDPDGDGLSSFEEQSGTDDPATLGLVPSETTDPNDADSDDDGSNDGHEALADTGPNDPSDRLHIRLIEFSPGNHAIEWDSRPGKVYNLYRRQNPGLVESPDLVAKLVPSAGLITRVSVPGPTAPTTHYVVELD